MKFPRTEKMKIRFEEFKEEIRQERKPRREPIFPENEFSYSVRFDNDDKKYFTIDFKKARTDLWMPDINRIFKKYGIELYCVNIWDCRGEYSFHCKFKS